MSLSIGICDITIDGNTYYNLGSDAIFTAQPTYETYRYGKMKKGYILLDYFVALDFTLSHENYDILKMALPALRDFESGLYDNPSNINYEYGKQVIIHPVDLGESKEYDITLFNAIPDPEQEFEKIYGKGVNPISIRLLALPTKKFEDNEFNSYFFIGDAEKAGVIN